MGDGKDATSENALESINSSDLLDGLIAHLNLKNDAALARVLEMAPAVVSKIRHGVIPVTAGVMLRMHEVSGLSILHLRLLMGDHRRRFGIEDKLETTILAKKQDEH